MRTGKATTPTAKTTVPTTTIGLATRARRNTSVHHGTLNNTASASIGTARKTRRPAAGVDRSASPPQRHPLARDSAPAQCAHVPDGTR